MRILIAARHPPGGHLPIGGVQSWCATVGAELERLGHSVSFWGPEWSGPLQRFEFGIISNFRDTSHLLDYCEHVVVVSHGVIDFENPSEHHKTFYTSEGVRDNWPHPGSLIRQPIDLDFWCPGDGWQRDLMTRFSYRNGLPFIPEIAKSYGLEYFHLKSQAPEEVRYILRRSAIVIATGRAALEAMACGCLVIIADDRKYQCPLVDFDPIGAMARNYSGRGGVEANQTNIESAINNALEDARKKRPKWMREHVIQHHDVVSVVRNFLEECDIPLTDTKAPNP